MAIYGDGYTVSARATSVPYGDISVFESRGYIYSDLDFIFKPSPLYLNHGLSADIARAFDGNAIEQSIKNIVLTNRYERPWKPEMGANIRDLLFENYDNGFVLYELQEKIQRDLERWEPRATIENVLVEPNEKDLELNIGIQYKIKSITEEDRTETVSIKISMERIR